MTNWGPVGLDRGNITRLAASDYNGWEGPLPSTSPFSGFAAQNLYGRDDVSSTTTDSNLFPYCPQSLEFTLPAFSFPGDMELGDSGTIVPTGSNNLF
ncbi:hypothetical protein PFICI_06616 [Pestalotiopsis fici W106-1]|uniref:Uncharacterized protein n=1 Tax=Pestalotiopsis fici (strain W106-1 / CGMCC3.15140) TaxID=1229662 RepID=W3X6E1_PESFW|nr:uncharacterized protein PFICI_06616 [Pestalotiopsis fici W106-1]ETS81614.1 hypothetical protein PFICI_06616 [Pestalotiopsis fici W106-1]